MPVLIFLKQIEASLAREMPFMVTEAILMAAVEAGGDRQKVHEAIRVHSQAAARAVKEEGRPNDLLARLAADPAFVRVRRDIPRLADPKRFTGLAKEQTARFLREEAAPVLRKYKKRLGRKGEVRV